MGDTIMTGIFKCPDCRIERPLKYYHNRSTKYLEKRLCLKCSRKKVKEIPRVIMTCPKCGVEYPALPNSNGSNLRYCGSCSRVKNSKKKLETYDAPCGLITEIREADRCDYLFCEYYDDCLDYAYRNNWTGWRQVC